MLVAHFPMTEIVKYCMVSIYSPLRLGIHKKSSQDRSEVVVKSKIF